MKMQKVLFTTMAGCALALGGATLASAAIPAPDCSTVTTVAGWKSAGACVQGDKTWTFTSTDLLDAVQLIFGGVLLTHNLQIVGFDVSDAAGAWDIKYSITVTDPAHFFISDMFAGADNPGGASSLVKNVTGDPGGAFVLTVTNGAEDAGSEKHGLTAVTLNIDEAFSIAANGNLLSVSNTYLETRRALPLPGTLALLGLGLVALGASRRTRKSN